MKNFILIIAAIYVLYLLQGCSATALVKATTIERDKKNGCEVHVILHIGIDGTDADVLAVKNQLEDCYGKTCIIPCNQDSSLGCKAITSVEVKKWSALTGDEQKSFHHMTMVDSDGTASFVDDLGTAGGAPIGGTWRRKEPPRTYCHEVLHLAGLPDQYCDRSWDAVRGAVVVARNCSPGPDPGANGNCCTASARLPRCTEPCPGHENDLMATLDGYVTCKRIMEVVAKAGLDNCPDKCCAAPPPMTARKTNPPSSTSRIDTTSNNNSYNNNPNINVPAHDAIPTPLHVGATLLFGYSGLYTHDQLSGDKQQFNGLNLGVGIGVQYQTCPHWTVEGRARLFEFDQVTHKDASAGYNTTYRFEEMGIDAHASYDFWDQLSLVFGPTVTFDLMASTKYSASGYNSGFQTNHTTKNVMAGFDVGFMYQVHIGKETIQPFIVSRFPFNSTLSAPNYQNYPFTLDAGATFNFFNK